MTSAVAPEVEARLTAALGLARRGYAIAHVYGVKPDGTCLCPAGSNCSPKNAGKHGGTGWLENATTDPEVIRTRFLAPDPNYGVVPLTGSGLVVVDEDQPGSLDALGPLPHTLIVWTGPKAGNARGRHVYGRLPAGIDEEDVPYLWAGGETRRAGNGQVIGPYSRHRSGLTYQPVNGGKVEELPEAWVRALIASGVRRNEEQSTAKSPADPGWFVTEPGRHPWLVSRARWLRGNGLSGDRLLDELRRLNEERCRPPKEDGELKDIIKWITKNITDDPPGVFLSAATAHIDAAERNGSAQIDSAASPVVAAASIPLRFRTAREMAAELPVEVIWCVFPWVVTGGITEVVGKIKSAGKTTLVMAMCRAVLDGLPFLGETTTKTAVVYLTEQPPSSLREALRRADLLEREDFTLLTWRDTAGHKWPDIVRAAVAECGRRKAGLLVVDTLGRFAGLRGDAENNAAEADAVMAELQIAAADGLSVIVIRHERKSGGDVGESGRGSSAYGGAVDIVLAVRRGEGNTRNTIRVIHALSRFDETPETLAIELTDDGYVARGNEAAVAIEEAVDALRAALPKVGTEGLTSAEVEVLLKTRFGRTTTQEAMKRLLEAGELERTGAGKKGNPYRHAIRSAAGSDESRRNELDELYADIADTEEPT